MYIYLITEGSKICSAWLSEAEAIANKEDGQSIKRLRVFGSGLLHVSVPEAARMVGVSDRTMRHWIRTNKVKGKKLPMESGHDSMRISVADLVQFLD